MTKLELKFDIYSEGALVAMNKTNKCIYLTGKAGTGKSTLIDHFKVTTKKKFILLGTTGIAAINIGGSTIHSFFKITPKLKTKALSKALKRLIRNIDTIVIDEVSMMRADLFDVLNKLMQEIMGNDEFMGGKQFIFVGDLYQLPPVVTKDDVEFNKNYDGPFFFNGKTFDPEKFHIIELQKVHRQDNPKFIKALNLVREGHKSINVLKYLNSRITKEKDINKKSILIGSTNYIVYGVNKDSLAKIKGKEYCFTAFRKGDFPENEYPADRVIKVKVGARIMFTKNDIMYSNGTLGTITAISERDITIKTDDGYSIDLARFVWPFIDGEDEDGNEIIVGTYTQFPIRLAFAVTIHKCIEENQRIKTEKGLEFIKNIKIGDNIDTGYGYKKVVNKIYSGKKEVFEVTTKSGSSVISTLEHKFLTNIDGIDTYKTLSELKTGDSLIINRNLSKGGVDIPLVKIKSNYSKDINIPKYIDEDLSYLIGTLIGDGSYNYKKDGRIDIVSQDIEILDFHRNVLKKYGINYLEKPKLNKAKIIIFVSRVLRDMLLNIGLKYATLTSKRIPESLFKSKFNVKAKLLQGLFDTDGSITQTSNMLRYVSVSKGLIQDIKLMLLDFGIISYVSKNKVYSDKHNQSYTLHISGKNSILFHKYIGFYIKYKQDKFQLNKIIGKTNTDFCKNTNLLKQEFKNICKGYSSDKQIHSRRILSKKRFSYNDLEILNKYAKGKCSLIKKTLNNNFYYDEIVSINKVGIRNTYDLEVDTIHSFTAEGFIVHNCQGKTFDNVVIDLGYGAFTFGMLYVAISRCTTLEGIQLVKKIKLSDVMASPKVKHFLTNNVQV